MNNKEVIDVECSHCGKIGEFLTFDSVTVEDEPEFVEYIKNLGPFIYTCPNCGQDSILTYNFTYKDLKNKYLLAMCLDKKQVENTYNLFIDIDRAGDDSYSGYKNFLKRIVYSPRSLREKIAIFDAGLDDRIIELIKKYISNFLKNHKIEFEAIEFMTYKGEDVYRICYLDGFEDIEFSKLIEKYDKYKNILYTSSYNYSKDYDYIIEEEWAEEIWSDLFDSFKNKKKISLSNDIKENEEEKKYLNKKLDKILEYIHRLSEDNIVEIEESSNKYVNNPISKYTKSVNDFIEDFYKFSEKNSEYRLDAYKQVLEQNNIFVSKKSLKEVDTDSIDKSEIILAMIMAVLMAERFSFGIVKEFIEESYIKTWLIRLFELENK